MKFSGKIWILLDFYPDGKTGYYLDFLILMHPVFYPRITQLISLLLKKIIKDRFKKKKEKKSVNNQVILLKHSWVFLDITQENFLSNFRYSIFPRLHVIVSN